MQMLHSQDFWGENRKSEWIFVDKWREYIPQPQIRASSI